MGVGGGVEGMRTPYLDDLPLSNMSYILQNINQKCGVEEKRITT